VFGGGARVRREHTSSARGLLPRGSRGSWPRSGRPKQAGPPLSFAVHTAHGLSGDINNVYDPTHSSASIVFVDYKYER